MSLVWGTSGAVVGLHGEWQMNKKRAVRTFEAIGILAFALLTIKAHFRLAHSEPGPAFGLTLLALPIAYYAADLLTGVIHWACDTLGTSTTPIWGPMLVASFRRHHRAPLDISKISLLENLGASAIAGTLVLLLWSPQLDADSSWAIHLAQQVALWTIGFAVLSNLLHRWAHWPPHAKPRWMLHLQKWGLILRPENHWAHHKQPYETNYCILCGWANPLCNRLPWRRLEEGLRGLGLRTSID